MKKLFLSSLVLFGCFLNTVNAETVVTSSGQTLYVPLFSGVFYGTKKRLLQLSGTISVRNLNRDQEINISQFDCHDDSGNLVKTYVTKPKSVKPLAVFKVLVAEELPIQNCIVKWDSEKPGTPAQVHTMLISTRGSQGLSFSTESIPIE